MPHKENLQNIVYINLPSNSEIRLGEFMLDPTIPLPLEADDEDAETIDPEEITWEAIIAGTLRVLAYHPGHQDGNYFRQFILAARPEIHEELTEAAIFKARNGDLQLAEELFLSLRGLFPENPQPLVNLALIYEEQYRATRSSDTPEEISSHHKQAVLTAYQQVLDIDPLHLDAHFNLAFFHSEIDEHERCIRHLEMYIKYSSDEEKLEQARTLKEQIDAGGLADDLFQNALAAIHNGEEQKGIEHARRFVQEHPHTWNGWFILGWGLRRSRQYSEARSAFERALQLVEPQVDLLNELAICNLELNDFEACERCLQIALEISPEDTRVIANLGVLHLRRGDTDEAMAYFRTVREIDPDDPVAERYLSTSG